MHKRLQRFSKLNIKHKVFFNEAQGALYELQGARQKAKQEETTKQREDKIRRREQDRAQQAKKKKYKKKKIKYEMGNGKHL